MKMIKYLLLLAVLGMAALVPGVAVAQTLSVRDELHLFSADAIAKANRRIAELKRVEHKDLVIETLPAPKHPANLDVKNQEAVKEFFDNYSLQRFRELRVDGVYIMILTKPEHVLRVDIGNNTRTKGYFTDTDRIGLVKILREGLQASPDETLVKAVNDVVDTMEKNHPASSGGGHRGVEHGTSGGFPWSTVLTIGAVILGIWVVFAVVRAMFSGGGMGGGVGSPGVGGGYGPGYGGGGFMQNFLGGMLGAAAGMWAYNSFFGGGTSSAWGAGSSDTGSSTGDSASDTSASVGGDTWGNAGGDAGADAGADAGGGDWGAEAGGADAGGDWGGGDAGGGDMGGGDMGGGGDW